jgi:D-arabinose 1-dehydrogenase-like Zn-dependent alcohol dehydrogenase
VRAVMYSAYGEHPALTTAPDPECPAGGVVIEVGATGVCRSDWHAWQGHDPVALPHIPGHELAGTVAEVGSGVTGWQVGDRVTVPFVCGCGQCEYCAAGEAQVCPHQTQPGFTGPGSYAERVAIHAAEENLVRLPDSVDFVTAASLGCRFATAFRALSVHGRVARGGWLVVHGCGGVGLSAVMIGTALGAQVIAVDVSPVLLLGPSSTPPLPMDVVIARELEIYGSHGMAAHEYPPMLALVADRTLRPDLLVGTVIGLAEAGAALAAMGHAPATAGMTVIEPAR